jgi:hypothetical protein
MAPVVALEALPARLGDCILLECYRDGSRPWRALIDGGPTDVWPTVRARLLQIPREERVVDLLVVTHIDHDHIGGIVPLLQQPDTVPDLTIGEVWFNGRRQLDEVVQEPDPLEEVIRSPAEGDALVAALAATTGLQRPWNMAAGGAAVSTAGNGESREFAFDEGPRITVLSPTPKRLLGLARAWPDVTGRVRRGETETVPEPPLPYLPLDDLDDLAGRKTAGDSSAANGSSIGFLVEHRGVRCLLAADGWASVLGAALKGLAERRGATRIAVDVFKLPHHGSQANVTATLVQLAPAQHYVVSTNGDTFDHPDDIALARVIVGSAGATLHFNYPSTERTQRWADAALQARYGFRTVFAESASAGVRLELASSEAAPG